MSGDKNGLDWWKIFDVTSKFFLGVAGLILSMAISRGTLENNTRAAERQAQSQAESLRAQREIAGVNLAGSLFKTVLSGSPVERTAAESILLSITPKHAEALALLRGASPQGQDVKDQMLRRATSRRQEEPLSEHLENARRYLDLSLHANAAREFIEAGKVVPDHLRELLNQHAFDEGKRLYDRGEFAGAVTRFREGLAKIVDALAKR